MHCQSMHLLSSYDRWEKYRFSTFPALVLMGGLYLICEVESNILHQNLRNILFLVGPEMIEALPPPPMFCSVCENDTGGKFGGSNCCAMEDTLVTKDRKVNRSSKKCFIGSENSFSTLPNVRSHSFSTKKPRKEDCKAGIQV